MRIVWWYHFPKADCMRKTNGIVMFWTDLDASRRVATRPTRPPIRIPPRFQQCFSHGCASFGGTIFRKQIVCEKHTELTCFGQILTRRDASRRVGLTRAPLLSLLWFCFVFPLVAEAMALGAWAQIFPNGPPTIDVFKRNGWYCRYFPRVFDL